MVRRTLCAHHCRVGQRVQTCCAEWFAVVRTGCLCKKTLGTAGGGLVHTVWNELGPDVTRYTINNIQFTVNYWLLQVRATHRGLLCILPVPVGRDFPRAATAASLQAEVSVWRCVRSTLRHNEAFGL